MKILAVVLIVAAAVMGALAGVRTYALISYNRRRRRRRKKPARLDGLTQLLYITAPVFLAAGILTAVLSGGPAENMETPSDPTGGTASAYGWREENGVRVYLKEDGTHALGWLDVDGSRYYISDDGTMYTGWLELDGETYYFDESGVMARGRAEIDGVVCFFTASGAQTLLVNPWNPVPEGYSPDLVVMDEYYGSEGLEIDSGCYEALKEMIDACNTTGSRAYVLSAYRSYETQQRIYDRKVDSLLSKGWSQSGAEKEAATVVALPGTSEHQLGLAVDIIDTKLWALEEGQENMPAQKWLMENCWRYGFVFRYPKEKTEVTGIIYEPWHYRYVGKALAAELHKTGQTLEEYIDSLN